MSRKLFSKLQSARSSMAGQRIRIRLENIDTDELFLTRAYLTILGRPVDTIGLETHLGAMARGLDRAQVLVSLMRSSRSYWSKRKPTTVSGRYGLISIAISKPSAFFYTACG